MRRGRPPYPGLLTPREQEVMALLQEGLTNEEIAERLDISRDGAKFHVSEILSKLGMQSRHQAATWQPAGNTGRFWGLGILNAVARKLSLEQVMKLTTGAVLAAAGIAVLLIALGIVIMESRSGGSEEAGATNDQVQEEVTPDVAPTVPTNPDGRAEFGWGDKVKYGIAGMDDVQIVADKTYKTVSELDMTFDLYLPADASDAERYPVVVIAPGIRIPSAGTTSDTLSLIHRDFKNKDEFSAYGRMVAASGMAAVVFNHRHEGYDLRGAKVAEMQAVIEDVRDLIAYVRSEAESLSVDPNLMCVWDGTAPFAAVAVTTMEDEAIRCLVMYYGPTDLTEVVRGVAADELASLQPGPLLAESWPPTFFVEATGAQWSNQAFFDAAQASGLEFELHTSGYGLGFDYLCGAEGGYFAGGDCDNNRQQTAQIIQAALDFVSRHLQN